MIRAALTVTLLALNDETRAAIPFSRERIINRIDASRKISVQVTVTEFRDIGPSSENIFSPKGYFYITPNAKVMFHATFD